MANVARTGSEGHIKTEASIRGDRQRNVQLRVVGIAEVVADVHVLACRPQRALGHHHPRDDCVDVEIHMQPVVVVRHVRVGVRVQNVAVGSVHPDVGQAVVGAEHRERLVRTGADRNIAIRSDRAQRRVLRGLDVAIARRTADVNHVVRAGGGADGQRRLIDAGSRGRRERDDDVGDRIVGDCRRHPGHREGRRARPAEHGIADGQILGAQVHQPEGAGTEGPNRHDVFEVRALVHRYPFARNDHLAVGAQHLEFRPQEHRHDDTVGKVVGVRGIRRLPAGIKSAADQQAPLRIERQRAHVLAGCVGPDPRPSGTIPAGHAARPVRSGVREAAAGEQRAFAVKRQRLDNRIPARIADSTAQGAPSRVFIRPVRRINVERSNIGHERFIHAPHAGGLADARPVFRPEKQIALRIEREGIESTRSALPAQRIPFSPLLVIEANHADQLKGGIVVSVAAIETRQLGKISPDVQIAIRGVDSRRADRPSNVVVQAHLPVSVVLRHTENVEPVAGGIELKDVLQVRVRQIAADIEVATLRIPRQRIDRARGQPRNPHDGRQDVGGGFVPVGSIPHGQRMRRPAPRPVESTAHHQPAPVVERQRIHNALGEHAARIDLQPRSDGLPARSIPFRDAVGRRSADAGEFAADIDHAMVRIGQNRIDHGPLRGRHAHWRPIPVELGHPPDGNPARRPESPARQHSPGRVDRQRAHVGGAHPFPHRQPHRAHPLRDATDQQAIRVGERAARKNSSIGMPRQSEHVAVGEPLAHGLPLRQRPTIARNPARRHRRGRAADARKLSAHDQVVAVGQDAIGNVVHAPRKRLPVGRRRARIPLCQTPARRRPRAIGLEISAGNDRAAVGTQAVDALGGAPPQARPDALPRIVAEARHVGDPHGIARIEQHAAHVEIVAQHLHALHDLVIARHPIPVPPARESTPRQRRPRTAVPFGNAPRFDSPRTAKGATHVDVSVGIPRQRLHVGSCRLPRVVHVLVVAPLQTGAQRFPRRPVPARHARGVHTPDIREIAAHIDVRAIRHHRVDRGAFRLQIQRAQRHPLNGIVRSACRKRNAEEQGDGGQDCSFHMNSM